jgi:hypothetical protein
MNPKFGRRSWVKLWVNEWLDGTTRFEMSDTQRAFWIDLLAMAGRSRFPGTICAGKTGEKFVGYPLNKFQSLMAEPIDVEGTFSLFERTGKIRVEVTADGPPKLFKVELVNWSRYQSEYQRLKKYKGRVQPEVRTRYAPGYAQSNKTEVEVEGEELQNHCANADGLHGGLPASKPDSEAAICRVWDYYIEKLGKNPKIYTFTPARKQKGLARLRECLRKTAGDVGKAEGLMRLAVDALAASPFHRGENDGNKRYQSWEDHLFKNAEQLEKWIERA